MQIVQVEGQPFLIGDVSIKSFQISGINFSSFLRIAADTPNSSAQEKKRWAAANKRLRIKFQVRAIDANKGAHELDDMSISQLPIPYALKIDEALTADPGVEGSVVSAGDGITTPIIYKLGNPIAAKNGSEKVTISELEFAASTYGDIEDVLAETNELAQAEMLLRTVAKPLGVNDTLQRLPSWAIDAIKLPDGMAVARLVLPHFLGQDVQSPDA